MTTSSPPTNGAPTPTAPLPLWQRVTPRQVALGTIVVALTILLCAFVVAIRNIFILFFLGIVVATALQPIADRLKRYQAGRGPAALVAFSVLLVIVAGLIAILAPFFIQQFSAFADELPASYTNLRETLAASNTRLVAAIGSQLPASPFGSVGGDDISQQILAYLPTVGWGILMTVMVLLLSYYWLYYRALAIQSVALMVPIDRRQGALDLWNEIEYKIGAFIRGLALLSLIIGVVSGVGYWFIGLPYALTIGIIAGLLEAVPYVGPIITMILSVIVGLSVSPQTAILALVVALIVQFLENSIVVPRVMDRAVGVNAVVTLLALTIFGDLFGVLGALLAVPLAAVIQVFIDRMMMRSAVPDDVQIGGRDRFALLRYKALDLASDLRSRVRNKTEESSAEEDAVEEELEAVMVDLDALLSAAQEQKL